MSEVITLNVNQLASYIIRELSSNEKIRFRFAASEYNEYRFSEVDIEDLIQRVAIILCKKNSAGWSGEKNHLNNSIYKKVREVRIDMMRESKALTRGFDLEVLLSTPDPDKGITWINEDGINSESSRPIRDIESNLIESFVHRRDLQIHLENIERDVEAEGLSELMAEAIQCGEMSPAISLHAQRLQEIALTLFQYDEDLKDMMLGSTNSSGPLDVIINMAKYCSREKVRNSEEGRVKAQVEEIEDAVILPLFSIKKEKDGTKMASVQLGKGENCKVISIKSSGNFDKDKMKLRALLDSESKTKTA